MIFETKFNIGEEVWYCDYKCLKATILGIRVRATKTSKFTVRPYTETSIEYKIGDFEWIDEDRLFRTKEKLIESL